MKSDGISSRTDISDVSLPWGEESARERGPLDNSSGSTDDDDIMEPLITRTRRLDLDALSFTGGVGHSNGFLFNKKVHKLRDENMMDHGHPTPQQQEQEEEEADFVIVAFSSTLPILTSYSVAVTRTSATPALANKYTFSVSGPRPDPCAHQRIHGPYE